jgi:hypothetical protein
MPDKANLIGASVTVSTENNEITNYNIVGEGLCSDQSNTLIFGLGDAKIIKSIKVSDIYGNIKVMDSVKVNSTIIYKNTNLEKKNDL